MNGRIQPGEKRNPEGRNQYTAARVRFERTIQALLEGPVSPDELEALDVPAGVQRLLPEGASREDALAAVAVAKALSGDDRALEALLKRLWPAPKPVEIRPGPDEEPAALVIRWKNPVDIDWHRTPETLRARVEALGNELAPYARGGDVGAEIRGKDFASIMRQAAEND